MLRQLLRIESLVFPAACSFCHEPVDDERAGGASERICNDCEEKILSSALDRCVKCGASVQSNNPFGDRCRLCQPLDLRFGKCVAIGDYRGHLRDVIIQTKRIHDEVAAMQLGRLLFTQIERFDLADCDWVVPVPTHWYRRFKRGFHTSSVIADGICRAGGLRKRSNLLSCRRLTRKQGTLLTPGRFKNVRNAFSIRFESRIKEKKILIVDDVMTSGATASEIARILIKAGAASANVAVAARGARVS